MQKRPISEKKLKSDNDEEAGTEVKADEAEVQAEGDEDGDGDVDGTYIWFSQNHWEIVPISHKQSTTFE